MDDRNGSVDSDAIPGSKKQYYEETKNNNRQCLIGFVHIMNLEFIIISLTGNRHISIRGKMYVSKLAPLSSYTVAKQIVHLHDVYWKLTVNYLYIVNSKITKC